MPSGENQWTELLRADKRRSKGDLSQLQRKVWYALALQRHLTEMRPKTLPLGLFLLMMIAQISGIKWPHAT